MEIEFEALHLLSLVFVAIVIIIADHDGYRYFRGKKALLEAVKVKRLHQLAWVGLGAMIATGIGLIVKEPEVLTEGSFWVKMFMVGALIVNGLVIGQLSRVSSVTPFASLSAWQKRALFVSAGVSTACWLGSALIGFGL
jgi:hypothetical protein